MSKYRTREAPDSGLAETLKALGHPHRLRLFQRLCAACLSDTGCCPGDRIAATIGAVAADLGVSPGTVSHHCKVLQAAGLMICERRGQQWACCVDARRVHALIAFFSGALGRGSASTHRASKRASQPARKQGTEPRSKP